MLAMPEQRNSQRADIDRGQPFQAAVVPGTRERLRDDSVTVVRPDAP